MSGVMGGLVMSGVRAGLVMNRVMGGCDEWSDGGM